MPNHFLPPLLSWGLARVPSGTVFTLLLSVLACSFGCSSANGVELGAADAIDNTCFADDECRSGYCSSAGFCQTNETVLSHLLLEITPPAGTESIAGVRFTQSIEIPTDGSSFLPIKLGHISRVSTTVLGLAVPDPACVVAAADVASAKATDGSFAVRLTLIPRERLLGLPSPSHSREVQPSAASKYVTQLSVPPGSYDIYVEPMGADGTCIRPPYLIVDQAIEAGDVSLNIELPVPERLDVTVLFPGYIDALNLWTLDVVDRASGRVLSNRVTLEHPVGLGGGLEYQAQLSYLPVVTRSDEPPAELVRLSPPDGVTAPTVYLERSVVELFQDGQGVIEQLKELPVPVSYTGRVNQVSSGTAVSAAVTLVATDLAQISSGVISAFSRTAKTDDEGVFQVQLLPGRYLVRLEPTDALLAQTETELTVSSSSESQAGKVLEVGLRSVVTAGVRSVAGLAVMGVPVQPTPAAALVALDVLDLARGRLPVVPQAEGVSTDENGQFWLHADPGVFHFLARPEPSTGFPWGIFAGVSVSTEDADFGTLVLSLPFELNGTLTSSDVGIVPAALIRAYAYLDGVELANSPEDATSVVAVGEGRVDDDGNFRLLLPSTLDLGSR